MVAPRFLLDTNTLSEPVRPRPSARLLEKLQTHRLELATATVVIHEMVYGLAKLPPSRKRDAIQGYFEQVVLRDVAILPYDLEAARWHGEERARLEKLGRPTPFRDARIAAIAKTRDLVLVTANLKDFRGLRGVEVESWM